MVSYNPGHEAPRIVVLNDKIYVILFPEHEAPYIVVLKYNI